MEYARIKALLISEKTKGSSSVELEALGKLWLEKKGDLEGSGEYQSFIKKMQREWAIETGIIERLYHWDRGVTETLIERGIDASLISHESGINRDEADNIAKLIADQQGIFEGLFSFIKGQQPFSEHFIRSMHQQFTMHQDYTEAVTTAGKLIRVPLLKGEYKKQSNNPKRSDGTIHEYCPPEWVIDEMECLVKLYAEYEAKTPPEILSSWLHHRFTQIHPFQDGNGRIARAIASLVFLKRGLFPLVIRSDDREDYISALELADKGDLAPLVKLFSKRQRDSILSALGIHQQVEQIKHAEQIIESAISILNQKTLEEREQIQRVYKTASNLQRITEEELQKIQKKLDSQLRKVENTKNETYNASMKSVQDGEAGSHYFRSQIIEMAKKHRYYANTGHYRSWSRIIIYTSTIYEIVLSIHGYGHPNNGVMVASGFSFEKAPSEEGSESIDVIPSNKDVFQFNYMENEDNIVKRYKEWLEDSIIFSLAQWQSALA